MKPFVKSLTFIVGIALTFAWRECLHTRTESLPVRYLPVLTVSEVEKDLRSLDHKEVRVRGILTRNSFPNMGTRIDYSLVSTSVGFERNWGIFLNIDPSSPAMSKVTWLLAEEQNQPFYERRKGQEVIVTATYYKFFSGNCILSMPGMVATDIEPVSLSDIVLK